MTKKCLIKSKRVWFHRVIAICGGILFIYMFRSFLLIHSYFGEYKIPFDGGDEGMYNVKRKKNAVKRVVWLTGRPSVEQPPRFNGMFMAEVICNNCNEEVIEKKSALDVWDKDCVPMSPWQSTFYPTCNNVHELDLASPLDRSQLLSSGSWRMTWQIHSHPRSTALKMLRLDRIFDRESFSRNQIDSVVMERLTHSPHVIHAYMFCGQTVLTEFADGDARNMVKQEHLTSTDRLILGLNLTSGLADIHGIDYPDGSNATFAHNDINPANIVHINSTIRFNDFNIGYAIRWNKRTNSACHFPPLFQNSIWRSPEEAFNTSLISEKADVFSIGNILFQALTTREPFKWLEPHGRPTYDQIGHSKRHGQLPFFPTKFTNSKDPATLSLYLATLASYTFNPTLRPSARQLATMIQQAIQCIHLTPKVTRKDLKRIFHIRNSTYIYRSQKK